MKLMQTANKISGKSLTEPSINQTLNKSTYNIIYNSITYQPVKVKLYQDKYMHAQPKMCYNLYYSKSSPPLTSV